MPANTQELIGYCLTQIAGISEGKAKTIASRFDSLKTFLNTPPSKYKDFEYVGGRKFKLTSDDLNAIKSLQASHILDQKLSNSQNFIKILAARFLKTQVTAINELTLEQINANPILIAALKLETPDEILRFYVFQAISRSVVTSMGSLVQDLLIHSGSNVYNAKTMPSSGSTKWDLVKKGVKGTVSWIEVKSGPNDIDRTQLLSYKDAIENIERKGGKGYIGETYGKRDSNTVSHGLYQQYLPEWESRTLIGKELWKFVSNDKDYPTKLIRLLRDSARKVLMSKTIIEEMEICYKRILEEFRDKYGNSDRAVQSYLDNLW